MLNSCSITTPVLRAELNKEQTSLIKLLISASLRTGSCLPTSRRKRRIISPCPACLTVYLAERKIRSSAVYICGQTPHTAIRIVGNCGQRLIEFMCQPGAISPMVLNRDT